MAKELKEYVVRLRHVEYVDINVDATSKEEAKRKAFEYEKDGADWSPRGATVVRVKEVAND